MNFGYFRLFRGESGIVVILWFFHFFYDFLFFCLRWGVCDRRYVYGMSTAFLRHFYSISTAFYDQSTAFSDLSTAFPNLSTVFPKYTYGIYISSLYRPWFTLPFRNTVRQKPKIFQLRQKKGGFHGVFHGHRRIDISLHTLWRDVIHANLK